jgi:pachytene checkpoint protein 2
MSVSSVGRLMPRLFLQGMSGRSLRRLPVLAHANYIGLPIPTSTTSSSSEKILVPASQTNNINGRPGSKRNNSTRSSKNRGEDMRKIVGPQTEVELWLDAMEKVVNMQIGDRSRVDAL